MAAASWWRCLSLWPNLLLVWFLSNGERTLYGKTGAALCHPGAGCVPGCCAAQQVPAAPGWVPPYCVWMEATLRARDPINQLLPQLTFPALKGIVLKRLGDVLSQLDCVFKLAFFTWGRKTLTNVEQTQSQCSQQEGDPSSFSSSPQEVTAATAVSVVLHGKAARYCAPFRYGK